MPFLRVGQVVIEVTEDVAEQWSALEAEAIAAAAARPYGRPSFWTRSERGGAATVRLDASHRATSDPGPATRPGLVERIALLHGDLGIEPNPPEEMTDDAIAEMVRGMKAERPHLDWDNVLTGRMIGPASPDRPGFPVWEYERAIARDPALRLADLTAARFPVRFPDGTRSVTSIDEELRPLPSHLPALPRARFELDAHAIIGRYSALHSAGLLEWDPVERGVVRLGTIDDHRFALEAWFGALAEHGTPPA